MTRNSHSEEFASDRPATEEEIQRVAEELADNLLAESPPGMGQFFKVPLMYPDLADMLDRLRGYNQEQNWYKSPEAEMLRVALEKRDRPALISAISTVLRNDRMSQKDLGQLPRIVEDVLPSAFRAALRDAAKNIFPTKPGPTPKAARREYPKMAQLGDRLAPVCEIVLSELQKETKHTVKEILDFVALDHPAEAAFLLKFLARFESALKDEKLASRAKGLKARARLMADAMAGAEYGLELRTSLERTREGRRMSEKRLAKS